MMLINFSFCFSHVSSRKPHLVHCLSSTCVVCDCLCLFWSFQRPFHFVNPCQSIFKSYFSLLSLSLSLSLSRRWAVCSLLHVVTPAPPRSGHNWLPEIILVDCAHTQTHKRANTRHRGGDGKAEQKARQGERKGSGSCRRLGLVSVYCWSWL